jgi:hypothetical protein
MPPIVNALIDCAAGTLTEYAEASFFQRSDGSKMVDAR